MRFQLFGYTAYKGGCTHDGNGQQQSIGAEIIQAGSGEQGQIAQTQQATHVGYCLGQGTGIEQHKAQANHHQHIAMPQPLRPPVQLQHPLFQQEHTGKQQTPQHKIPAGTVPEARQHPDHQGIEQPAVFTDPVAAQGNIHIVTEPAA